MVLYDDEKKTEKTYKKEVKRNVPQYKHQRKISAALKKKKEILMFSYGLEAYQAANGQHSKILNIFLNLKILHFFK